MNKYYIAWPLPSAFTKAVMHAQRLVNDWISPATKRMPEEELHVTALYIGKAQRGFALDLMRTFACSSVVEAVFGEFEVFRNKNGPHALVLKIKDVTGGLKATHQALLRASNKVPDFQFNPHVTLAKSDGFTDPGLVRAAEVLNINYKFANCGVEFAQAALYEKVEGGKYQVSHVYDFRSGQSQVEVRA